MKDDAPSALTHLDAQGKAAMVDVTGKAASRRRAVARGALRCSPEAFRLLAEGGKVEYRVDKAGNVHVPVGKASFDGSRLLDNTKLMKDPAHDLPRYVITFQ